MLLHIAAEGANIDRQFGHHTLRRSRVKFTTEVDLESILTLEDMLGHEDEAQMRSCCGLTIDSMASMHATVSERSDRTRAQMKMPGETPKPPSIHIVR